MDERALLLLGLLKAQSQHGYQINEFIENNLKRMTSMKKATAYAILERLHSEGYVRVRMEQSGNRPPRKVYSVTHKGDEKFLDLLRAMLGHVEPLTFAEDIGLMFLDHLPRREVLQSLTTRLEKLNDRIAVYKISPQHGHGLGVDLAIEHILVVLEADRDWLQQTIERLTIETS